MKSPFIVAWFGGVMAIALLSAGLSAAEGQLTERERIMAEIEKDLQNEEARQAAIQAGEERSILCSNCHGIDGNSLRPEIPNLAEQNTAYLIEQIGKFADGRRKHFVMQVLSRDFTFQDKVNLAVYYASQELKPIDADPRLAARGERIYQSLCFVCHGSDGRGEAGYALIAGQQIEYAKMTLKRFRANAMQANDFEVKKRTSLDMEQATAQLSDADIEGLAHYMALMK